MARFLRRRSASSASSAPRDLNLLSDSGDATCARKEFCSPIVKADIFSRSLSGYMGNTGTAQTSRRNKASVVQYPSEDSYHKHPTHHCNISRTSKLQDCAANLFYSLALVVERPPAFTGQARVRRKFDLTRGTVFRRLTVYIRSIGVYQPNWKKGRIGLWLWQEMVSDY